MKKCIFYLPYKLDEKGAGARMLRPRKMIKAFTEIGYEVFVIEGYSSKRRRQISELKKRIRNGEKYDFMYTESHTEPTLLTDPHHLPTHPFLDFSFFRFIKKQGIKIGLFYCDIYWKFDSYGNNLPGWKKNAALLNYRYDIWQYRHLLDQFYVPDLKVCKYVDERSLTAIAKELPPGSDDLKIEKKSNKGRDFQKHPLTVFYVGGVGQQYQIIELVKAVAGTENTRLVICCRSEEWDKEKIHYADYLSSKIEIIHRNSSELEEYYRDADICSLLFEGDEYRKMAKPFKAYEYLAHEIPSLSTKGTAIGDFIEKNDLGWNIEFDEKVIADTLEGIIRNPLSLEEKTINCTKAKNNNLWTSRAKQVADDLSH